MSGCVICGAGLVYEAESSERTCVVCNRVYGSKSVCENGHFVCDTCHRTGVDDLLPYLLNSEEKSPVKLMQYLLKLPRIHMHGPEHHILVPCVLLTAYHNSGGEINLEKALEEAVARGKQIPGGVCGFWGVCGAAAGAGVYASIVTGSNPLNSEAWHLPQILSSRCLEKIAGIGGPRCCKRTSHIAIYESIVFTEERLGITILAEDFHCTYSDRNKECLRNRCPFFTKE